MMEVRWLSYPMSAAAPRPPAIPAPRLTEFMSIAETGANVMFLQAYNHTGSHLDTSGHVFENGATICDFTPQELTFTRVKALDLTGLPDDTVVTPAHLSVLAGGSDADALLLRFGVEQIRRGEPARFSAHCPGLNADAARYILAHMPALRMVGTDVPSIACIAHLAETMDAHNAFFDHAGGDRFLILEEMKLDGPLAGITKLTVSPWLVEGMNSGPCLTWAEYGV